MSFKKKTIDVSFDYADASVGKLALSGLRASLIAAVVTNNSGQLEIAIFGLSLSHMNALTLIGTDAGTTGQNTITVTAGEEGGTMATVFVGTVRRAVADATRMPEVAFRVSATVTKYYDIKPAKPTSLEGSVDVSKVAKQIAQQMGLTLEDGGVQTKLSNPYLHGTSLTQMRNLAQHAGIDWTTDMASPTLAVWPRGGSRGGGGIQVSPSTGLVRYPSYTSSGIALQMYFNPDAKIGVVANVQSDFTPACGAWNIVSVEHELDSQTPGGNWFTFVETVRMTGSANAE